MAAASSLVLAQTPDSTPPWRRSDSTLVQICFDGLDSTAPKRLKAASVTPTSISGAWLDLVGFTLSNRPIYQGSIEHPVRFRSLLVEMPGSTILAKIDAPTDLPKHIDVWRDVPISLCTMEERADFKVLSGTQLQAVPCPDLGVHASLKVAASSEHSLEIVHLKARGPSSFNGLRGCRESVYGPSR
jgi:hypothetical protein